MIIVTDAQRLAEQLTLPALVAVRGADPKSWDASKICIEAGPDGTVRATAGGSAATATVVLSESRVEGVGAVRVAAKDLVATLNSMRGRITLRAGVRTPGMVPNLDVRCFGQSPGSTTLWAEGGGLQLPSMDSRDARWSAVLPRRHLAELSEVFRYATKQRHRPQFYYSALRVSRHGLRAVSGDGSRFVVLEHQRGPAFGVGDSMTITLAINHAGIFGAALRTWNDEEVRLEIVPYGERLALVSRSAQSTVALLGYDNQAYPNELKFVERVSPIRVVTHTDAWRIPVKRSLATYTENIKQANRMHATSLIFNFVDRTVAVVGEGEFRSNGVIPILDVEQDGEPRQVMTVRVVTDYLTDLLRVAHRGRFLHIGLVAENNPLVCAVVDSDLAIADAWSRNYRAVERTRRVVFVAAYTGR